jgi:uncharacterized protein (TIGR03437 family)
MPTRLLLFLLALTTPAAAQLTHANSQACCLVPGPPGTLYVIGAANDNVSITKLDTNHRILTTFEFGGGGQDQPLAATLDPQGNLLIAGQTTSPDFPLRNALFSQTAPSSPAGFLARVDPNTGQLLYSTRLGGQASELNFRLGTAVHALAVDPAGNIYAAGRTTAADFPVSPDAFQKSGALSTPFGPRPYGFVLKLSPAGERLLYSTLLGGATPNCLGGSHCLPIFAATTVNAIAVDRNGIVTAAGDTNARDFPTTPGALQTICRCSERTTNGFLTQLNATGSALRWSTFLGGSFYGPSQIPSGVTSISAVAQDPSGNILAAGYTDADDFPTTPNAYQPRFAGDASGNRRTTDGFLAKLNPTGAALVFSTYLGGPADDRIRDLQLDPQNNIWLTGLSNAPNTFYAQLNPTGDRLLSTQPTPAGATGQALRLTPQPVLLGPSGAVLRAPLSGPVLHGIASSFEGPVKPQIAPGEFVSLYGRQLAGAQVRFNGIPAPLLYTSEGQVNALVPYGIGAAATVTVEVTTPNGPIPPAILHRADAQPAILRQGAAALALNSDGTLNSPENPAPAGSIVTLYASGAGLLSQSPPDGSLSPLPFNPFGPRPLQPVALLADGLSLELLYAGGAPGLIINLLQLNVRLPARPGAVFQLLVGGRLSAPFTIPMR